MEQSEAMRFAEIMAGVGAVFSPLNDQQLDIYFDCLSDYSIEDISRAAKIILKTKQFSGKFPSIADFVVAIENRDGDPEAKAELAWRTLVKAIEDHGYYDSVQFEDGAIGETVRTLGGWMRITGDDPDWRESQLQWRKKEFITLYKNYARQNPESTKLLGFIEVHNRANHKEFIPQIIFIGSAGHIRQIENRTLKQIDQYISDLSAKIEMEDLEQ